MDTTQILKLVKARLGIRSDIRDEYLTAIIKGVIDDLVKIKGIKLDPNNNEHLMFIVDWSHYRYSNRDDSGDMPRNLRFRLNNLFVHSGGGNEDDGGNDSGGNGGSNGGDELPEIRIARVKPLGANSIGEFMDEKFFFNGGQFSYILADGEHQITIPQYNPDFVYGQNIILDTKSNRLLTSVAFPAEEGLYWVGDMHIFNGVDTVYIEGIGPIQRKQA